MDPTKPLPDQTQGKIHGALFFHAAELAITQLLDGFIELVGLELPVREDDDQGASDRGDIEMRLIVLRQ